MVHLLDRITKARGGPENLGSNPCGNAWGNALRNLAIMLFGACLTEAATYARSIDADTLAPPSMALRRLPRLRSEISRNATIPEHDCNAMYL
jgi:hypothetical protein